MARLYISFPPTPYTNKIANQRLIELGAPKVLVRENENRADVIRESVVLGCRMTWLAVSKTAIAIIYTGTIPRGVETALRDLQARGVITSWGKGMTEGRSMFDDLIETWQELGNMLADVAHNFSDMHPDDVIGVLDNSTLKASELIQGIAARREYVKELRPYWRVTESGADAGMPPAGGKPIVPPVTGEGKDLS